MCKVEWCSNKPDRSGKGYCRMHYDQIRKYGTITNFRPNGNRNDYYKKGDYTELHLLDNEGNIKTIAKVDNDDVEMLKKYSFRYEEGKYVKTIKNNKTIYIHQLILGKTKGMEIDHINRDKLDNRKENLRIVEHCINTANKERNETTNIRLTERNLTKKYYVSYSYNKKHYYVGYFRTLKEAREALSEHRKSIGICI